MKDIMLLIAIVIIFIFFLFENISIAKKDGINKMEIAGLIMSIVGIIMVVVTKIFGK